MAAYSNRRGLSGVPVGLTVDTPCEPWLDKKGNPGKGYGYTHRADGKVITRARETWEVANGPVPEGMHVCHRCDNPPCVRLDHLFIGTPADNAADRWIKRPAGPRPIRHRAAERKAAQRAADQAALLKAGREAQERREAEDAELVRLIFAHAEVLDDRAEAARYPLVRCLLVELFRLGLAGAFDQEEQAA